MTLTRTLMARMARGGIMALALAGVAAAHLEVSAGELSGAAVAGPAIPVTAPALQTPCSAPAAFTQFERPLGHLRRRLANGTPLTIVAIGSSSTAGAGASSPAAAYPSRLAVELRHNFPGHEIT